MNANIKVLALVSSVTFAAGSAMAQPAPQSAQPSCRPSMTIAKEYSVYGDKSTGRTFIFSLTFNNSCNPPGYQVAQMKSSQVANGISYSVVIVGAKNEDEARQQIPFVLKQQAEMEKKASDNIVDGQ